MENSYISLEEKSIIGSLYCVLCEKKEYAKFIVNGYSVCELHKEPR